MRRNTWMAVVLSTLFSVSPLHVAAQQTYKQLPVTKDVYVKPFPPLRLRIAIFPPPMFRIASAHPATHCTASIKKFQTVPVNNATFTSSVVLALPRGKRYIVTAMKAAPESSA